MNKLKIEYVDINSIKPYKNNAKEHPQEHIDKIKEIKKHINNSKGKPKQQYTKCLHKLQKQALQCYMYMNKDKDLMYIKKI